MPSNIVLKLIEDVAALKKQVGTLNIWMYFSVGTAITTLIAVVVK